MSLNLAISPCPNDTFAFYALLAGKTGWQDPLETHFEDIEALNHRCLAGNVDICKISFHAYIHIRERYQLLGAGSALGFGCGPLLVAKTEFALRELPQKTVAVPGRYTTAALLLSLMAGTPLQTVEMTFDQIMPAVAAGQVDAGLIIHESRFTYAQHGLTSLLDLGDWWERESGYPIPLGGIVAAKRLPDKTIANFDAALAESIDYAWSHRDEVRPFMRRHAQEMEDAVMDQHVGLYVNRFTHGLGSEGRAAIDHLVDRAAEVLEKD